MDNATFVRLWAERNGVEQVELESVTHMGETYMVQKPAVKWDRAFRTMDQLPDKAAPPPTANEHRLILENIKLRADNAALADGLLKAQKILWDAFMALGKL